MEGYLTLTGFTVLAQTAAGMAILKAICPKAERIKFDPWVLVAIVLLGLGTLISLFHLNSPFRGYLALANPFNSWLSAEIYSVVFFGLTLLASFASTSYLVRLLSAIAGGFMIFVMAEVYMFTNAISWGTWNTPVTFYSTALLLGAVALFSTGILSKKDNVHVLLGPLPALIGILVIVRMVAVALLVLRSEVKADIMLMDMHITFTLLGAVFVLIRIMQRVFKYKMDPVGKKMPCVSCCAIGMFTFVVIGELAGRLMFYMLYSNTGL